MARLWTSSIIYGIYSMLFAGSIYVLLKHHRNKLFLVGSIAVFILTTAITIFFFLESLLRPVATSASTFTYDATVPCSQVRVENHETVVGSLLVVLISACKAAIFFVADATLIFRCAVLWHLNKLIIAFPSCLLLASTVCNLAQVYYGARMCYLAYHPTITSTSALDMAMAATRFSDASTSLSLATNVLTSFLVALKIWLDTKEIKSVLGKKVVLPYRALIAMFIESGVLFSASLAAELAMTFSLVPIDICEVISGYMMVSAPTLVTIHVRMGAGFGNVHETFNLSDASHIVNAALHRDRPTAMLSAMHFASVQETSTMNSESGGGE